MSSTQLELGNVVTTERVRNTVIINPYLAIFVKTALASFRDGDWGLISYEDKLENDHALQHDGKIISRYQDPIHPDRDIRIIRDSLEDGERYITTVMFPDEY